MGAMKSTLIDTSTSTLDNYFLYVIPNAKKNTDNLLGMDGPGHIEFELVPGIRIRANNTDKDVKFLAQKLSMAGMVEDFYETSYAVIDNQIGQEIDTVLFLKTFPYFFPKYYTATTVCNPDYFKLANQAAKIDGRGTACRITSFDLKKDANPPSQIKKHVDQLNSLLKSKTPAFTYMINPMHFFNYDPVENKLEPLEYLKNHPTKKEIEKVENIIKGSNSTSSTPASSELSVTTFTLPASPTASFGKRTHKRRTSRRLKRRKSVTKSKRRRRKSRTY